MYRLTGNDKGRLISLSVCLSVSTSFIYPTSVFQNKSDNIG